MSVVKRRKLRAQELTDISANLHTTLPVLNLRQIRRHRIPYSEACCLELDEDGYDNSASFIRGLIEFQNKFRKIAGPESLTWFKPVLSIDHVAMDMLFEGLRAAEEGKRNNHIGVECDHLLQLGVYFAVRADAWAWLAEQILIEAASTASFYADDGGERHAMARYIFGRFLLSELNNAKEARDQLQICRDLSAGKKWSAKTILQIPQDNLFKECCSLLYRALLILAKLTVETNPKQAARMCTLAQKRAIDAEDSTGEVECLMNLGLCQMEFGDSAAAKKIFNKLLITNFSLNNFEGVCDTRIQLALANANLGKIQEAFYHLNLLLEYAQKNELKYYYGQCLRFLGEMHMYHRSPSDATPFLSLALEVFHELDDIENREQVRNLACISKGLGHCKAFRLLLQKCDQNPQRQRHLNILIDWKDCRKPFWLESEMDIGDVLQGKLIGEEDMDYGEMTPGEYEYDYSEDSQNSLMEVPSHAVVLEIEESFIT